MNQVKTDMFKSESLEKFAPAFVKMQTELCNSKKDSKGYGYNYSDLATVIESSREVLTKHGFGVTQLNEEIVDGHVRVTTLLLHSSGEYLGATSSMPVIEMKGCNAAQGAGASLSYLRRYSYQAITGQASEDNDASSQAGEKKSFKKETVDDSMPVPKVDSSKKNEQKESKSDEKPTRFRRNKVADKSKKEEHDI